MQTDPTFISPSLAATLLRIPRTTLDLFVSQGVVRCHRLHDTAHRKIELESIEEMVQRACGEKGIPMRSLRGHGRVSPLVRVDEVARMYGYSTRHVRQLSDVGILPGFKLGRAWFFWRLDVFNGKAPVEAKTAA